MFRTLEEFLSRLQRDLVGGGLQFLTLAIIGRHGPIHGYALIRALSDAAGGAELFKNSTVYPILNELEREKLVRSQWADGGAGPKRRDYELTPLGRQALRLAHREWARLHSAVDSLFTASETRTAGHAVPRASIRGPEAAAR